MIAIFGKKDQFDGQLDESEFKFITSRYDVINTEFDGAIYVEGWEKDKVMKLADKVLRHFQPELFENNASHKEFEKIKNKIEKNENLKVYRE